MAYPRRIVSLAPSNTEIVAALGCADRLVGVDDWSDYPEAALMGLPRVGGDLRCDFDRVAACAPDLVLASLSVPGMEANVVACRERGLAHAVLDPTGWEGMLESILTIGAALGVPGRAQDLVAELRGRAAALPQAGAGRRLYWEWWPKPVITPGGASWITDLCAMLGATNAFADLPARSRPVTEAQVCGQDPDAVFLCWCGTLQRVQDPARVAARGAPWADLRAVTAGRVYALPEALFGRPGPRLADGLEMLAGILRDMR